MPSLNRFFKFKFPAKDLSQLRSWLQSRLKSRLKPQLPSQLRRVLCEPRLCPQPRARRLLAVAIALALIFVASSYALWGQRFFLVHDYTTGARIAEMTRGIAAGHIPVRWTANFGYGYGMPLFQFYGPLPYYLAGVGYWLGLSLIGSIKLLYLMANLGTIVGGFLFGKELASSLLSSSFLNKFLIKKDAEVKDAGPWLLNTVADAGGVVAAAALTLAPYRAVNLYVRGALNETWGLMALPWILWSMMRVIKSSMLARIPARETSARSSVAKSSVSKKFMLASSLLTADSLTQVLALTASLTVLFLSHNITSLIFAPFALLFALIFSWYWSGRIRVLASHQAPPQLSHQPPHQSTHQPAHQPSRQPVHQLSNQPAYQSQSWLQAFVASWWRLGLAGLLALGLSAFYLLPAFLEKGLTQVDDIILGDYFNFNLHFLYLRQFVRPNWGFGGSEWGPNDKISFFLGYGQLLGLVLSLGLTVVGLLLNKFSKFLSLSNPQSNPQPDPQSDSQLELKTKYHQLQSWLLLALLGLLGSSLLLSTHKTQFLWQALPLLKYVQFPWRFMTLAVVWLAALGALLPVIIYQVALYSTPLKATRLMNTKKTVKRLVIVFSLVIFALLTLNAQYFRPQQYLDNPTDVYYANPDKIRQEMSGILPDYLPQALDPDIGPTQQLVLTPDEVDQDKSQGTYQIEVNRVAAKLIRTDFKHQQTLTLAIADYPGWQLYLDEQELAHDQQEQGLITTEVPPGQHYVAAKFHPTPLRLVSDIISAVSLLAVLALVYAKTKANSKFTPTQHA